MTVARFTDDRTTPIGMVRLFVNDTTHACAKWDDTDIQALLDARGCNVHLAASDLLMALALEVATTADGVQFGGATLNGPEASEAIRRLAKDMRETAARAGVVCDDITPLPDLIAAIRPPAFRLATGRRGEE